MIRYQEPVLFSGGVARKVGVIKAIEEVLGLKVTTPQEPQLNAALGAAVMAKERSP